MILPEIISSTEKLYLTLLEEFFVRKWGDTVLLSHDLSHHKRVWEFAKELLECSEEKEIDDMFVVKLLISCYLHDIGMSSDQGVNHGSQSRKSAEEFLESNNLKISDFKDVLYAIESHDNKDYVKKISDNMLLKILSIADDLDAFGQTGIERYIEIYRARGIPEQHIGSSILENAAARFGHFELFATGKPELFGKHKKRYLVLREFFENFYPIVYK